MAARPQSPGGIAGSLLPRLRPYFAAAAALSLVLNVLVLVPALFMLQVFDRVLASRSVETLAMLAVLALAALAFMAYLDIVCARACSRPPRSRSNAGSGRRRSMR